MSLSKLRVICPGVSFGLFTFRQKRHSLAAGLLRIRYPQPISLASLVAMVRVLPYSSLHKFVVAKCAVRALLNFSGSSSNKSSKILGQVCGQQDVSVWQLGEPVSCPALALRDGLRHRAD